MNTQQPTPGTVESINVTLTFASGNDNIRVSLPVVCSARRCNTSGRTMIQLPPPYDDIEYFNGERIGRQKEARLRAAIVALGGQIIEGE